MQHPLNSIAECGRLGWLRERRSDWAFEGKAVKPKDVSKTPPKSKQFVLTQGKITEKPLPKRDANPAWDNQFDERRITSEVFVTAYGKTFSFRKCNRGLTIYDSRFPKLRRQPDFVHGELIRILGQEQGTRAFAHLTTL